MFIIEEVCDNLFTQVGLLGGAGLMSVPTYTVKHYNFAASDDFWGILPFPPLCLFLPTSFPGPFLWIQRQGWGAPQVLPVGSGWGEALFSIIVPAQAVTLDQLNRKRGQEAHWLIDIPCSASMSNCCLNLCTVRQCNMQARHDLKAS